MIPLMLPNVTWTLLLFSADAVASDLQHLAVGAPLLLPLG
jgi:hypothetical protein